MECSASKGSDAPSALTAMTLNLYSLPGVRFSRSNLGSEDDPAGIQRPKSDS